MGQTVRLHQRIEDEETAEREVRGLSPVPEGLSPPSAGASPADIIRQLAAEADELRERLSIITSSHAMEMQNMMTERQSLFEKARRLGERVRELEHGLSSQSLASGRTVAPTVSHTRACATTTTGIFDRSGSAWRCRTAANPRCSGKSSDNTIASGACVPASHKPCRVSFA